MLIYCVKVLSNSQSLGMWKVVLVMVFYNLVIDKRMCTSVQASHLIRCIRGVWYSGRQDVHMCVCVCERERERERDQNITFNDCSCSVAQSCLTLCDPMDYSTPGFPVLHYLWGFAQTHVHWVGVVIQPSHPLSSPSPPAFNPSQHQGLFQWVGSSYHVAKVLELQLQHQSFNE